jgi:Myb/SANT-like DNA-binding domain
MAGDSKEKGKRSRGQNYTTEDKALLVDLVFKYKNIIENKQTDGVNSIKKTEAWKKICEEFNSVSLVTRDYMSLKNCYEGVKKTTKKDASKDKIRIFKTGGGTSPPQISCTGEKILALLGPSISPLTNPFDSDAGYNSEAIIRKCEN